MGAAQQKCGPHLNRFTILTTIRTMKHDSSMIAAGAPPAGISGLMFLGLSLPDWVLLGTAIYTLLALIALIRDKYWQHWEDRRNDKT